MCGILGYFSMAEPSMKREFLHSFFKGLEETQTRGRDATGVAFFDDKNDLHYCKAPLKAEDFLKKEGVKEFMEKFNPNLMLAHCRQHTTGSEKFNVNNHPIIAFDEKNQPVAALIHNGMITNHDRLPMISADMRKGTVDSEVILLLVRAALEGKEISTKLVIEAIEDMAIETTGSQACAMLMKELPNTLFLWRKSNPLSVGYFKEWKTFVFGSTPTILEKVCSEHVEIIEEIPVMKTAFGMITVPEDTILAVSFGEDGKLVIEHGKISNIHIGYEPPRTSYPPYKSVKTYQLGLGED